MSSEIERPLPHSDQHERAILGSILIENPGARAILDRLRDQDFLIAPHREIFAAARALAARSESTTDLLAVYDELRRTSKIEAAGGIEYIAQLGDDVPRGENLEYHARSLKSLSARREMARAALEIYEAALLAPGSTDELLDRGIEKFSEIARDLEADRDGGATFREAAAALLHEFDSGDGLRIFTGVEPVDRITGGFRPRELVIFTAETGTGKTLYAQGTRRRSCQDGRHTLFCSGEMSAPHLVSRELATEADVEHWKMRRPERITPEESRALVEAASHECTQCRILDGELTLPRIRRVGRQMKAQTGVDLVVIDYDELVEAPGKDEFEQQRNIARASKSLAVELNCTVILISQLRKALQGEDRKRPTLQRLYGSGAKAKHASIVIYVDRPFVQELCGDETEARIVIVKNRDGKVGAIDALFNVKTLRFEGAPRPQPQQPDWVTR